MGANPMKDSAQKGLVLVASLNKVTTIEPINREENAKLFAALDSYPHHAFSPVGRRNVCHRFGISDADLELCLCAYVHPDAPPEIERRAAELARLLGAIEAVVKPVPERKAASKGKRKGGAKC